MKKRVSLLSLCFCMTVFSLLTVVGKAETPPPVSLERTSLEETNQKCAQTVNFKYTYVFGDKEIVLNSQSCSTWFVTKATAELYAAEVREEGKERAGYFLINGQETVLPEVLGFENGFATDENGNLIVSESAMYDTLKLMFAMYNSRVEGGTTVFYSTSGRTVFFGAQPDPVTEVNMDEEFAKLKKAFLEHTQDASEVVYTEIVNTDIQTVGNSYIEVDLTTQHMYLYLEGELIVDTPVVTGDKHRGMETPSGIWPILSMSRNAVLRGPGYAAPVSYWIPFTVRGHGIHDSTWRTSGYGGEIYIYDGSHGCVNTPLDKVSVIYENAYVGLPVVVFH